MTVADDGLGLAAIAIVFAMATDRAATSPEEAERVKDMLDRVLLGLEHGQVGHRSQETVALARSYIESLLRVVGTTHPAPEPPGLNAGPI